MNLLAFPSLVGLLLIWGCASDPSPNEHGPVRNDEAASGPPPSGAAARTDATDSGPAPSPTETGTGGAFGTDPPHTPDAGVGETEGGDPRRCDDTVRQCVCMEWGQGDCCRNEWDTFCQVTAEQKCGATAACGVSVPSETEPRGACCEPHTGPGCDEPITEQCVCELLPDCCEKEWDALCVQLVNEQHCTPGVRGCVCDEWELDRCCTEAWTTLCGLTAEEKCGGTPSCD